MDWFDCIIVTGATEADTIHATKSQTFWHIQFMCVLRPHIHIHWKLHILYLDICGVCFGLGGKGGAEAPLKFSEEAVDSCDCTS